MANQELCNRQLTGSCGGCEVPAIVWRKAVTKQDVDPVADAVSTELCPEGMAIDPPTRATVYNHKPDGEEVSHESVW